jgi:hypothetical protein
LVGGEKVEGGRTSEDEGDSDEGSEEGHRENWRFETCREVVVEFDEMTLGSR